MKHALLFLLVLFSVTHSFGQTYFIDLQKQTIHLPNRNFYVSQVVDARRAKSSIGQVQKGLNNTKADANFRNGVEVELLAFLNRNFPHRPVKRPLF